MSSFSSVLVFPRRTAVSIDKGPAAIRFLVGRGVAPTYPGLQSKTRGDYLRAAATVARSWKSTAHWLSKERLFAEGARGPGLNDPGWPQDGSKGRFRSWELVRLVEQPGRPENRVRLSESRDVLGRPRILIDWNWSAEDATAALRTKAVLDDALAPYGSKLTNEKLALARPGTGHIIGCTRMHTDPALGVVDEHCRVHGTRNLHVAGSSVFPSGSWANPTFTAVALGLRLGESLRAVDRTRVRDVA